MKFSRLHVTGLHRRCAVWAISSMYGALPPKYRRYRGALECKGAQAGLGSDREGR